MSQKVPPPGWIPVTPGCITLSGYVPVPPQLTIATARPASRQRSALAVSFATATRTASAFSAASWIGAAWPSQLMTPLKLKPACRAMSSASATQGAPGSTPARSSPMFTSITPRSRNPDPRAAASSAATLAASSTATITSARRRSAMSRAILRSPAIWLAIRMSRIPAAVMTSASPSFAQVIPIAPAASSRWAIAGTFWPFVWGRQLTPALRQAVAMRAIFWSRMSRSTTSAGVSSVRLCAPIRLGDSATAVPAVVMSELDSYVAERIEGGPCLGRHHARRIVLLDDEGSVAGIDEIAATQDRGVEPPSLRTEVRAPRRRPRAGLGPARLELTRHRGSLVDSQSDDRDGDELHRFVGARAVAVGALVLAAERLLDRRDGRGVERSLRDRHGQFERLAVVVQMGVALNERALPREALGGELRPRLVCHLRPGSIHGRQIDFAQQGAECPRVVMLHSRVEQAKGREQPRRRRHDDARHAQRLGHARGEERPVAAEGKQCVLARIASALGGDGLDGTDHVGGGDLVGTVRRALQREPERPSDLLR